MVDELSTEKLRKKKSNECKALEGGGGGREAQGHDGVARHQGGAVQVDSIKTRVESACDFSALNWNIINCFQVLLLISTCAATARVRQERADVNL